MPSVTLKKRNMASILSSFSIFYETPTDSILESRRTFYLTKKEATEPIAEWLCRIRDAIEHCDFGAFSNFLIIDKFFCGLDDDAKRWLRKTKTWSMEQLYQEIGNSKFFKEAADPQDVIAVDRLGCNGFLKIDGDDVVRLQRMC